MANAMAVKTTNMVIIVATTVVVDVRVKLATRMMVAVCVRMDGQGQNVIRYVQMGLMAHTVSHNAVLVVMIICVTRAQDHALAKLVGMEPNVMRLVVVNV